MWSTAASSGVGAYSSTQCGQFSRTSRWARMPISVVVIRKCGTPRSSSRVIEDGASFVCSVDSTRWPVSAAWIAFSAVSVSRISPTMMMSGSWRNTVRSVLANVMSTCGRTATWLKSSNTISIGSSIVMMFTSGLLRYLRTEYSVVVLPLPVGPVTRMMPVGLEMKS